MLEWLLIGGISTFFFMGFCVNFLPSLTEAEREQMVFLNTHTRCWLCLQFQHDDLLVRRFGNLYCSYNCLENDFQSDYNPDITNKQYCNLYLNHIAKI